MVNDNDQIDLICKMYLNGELGTPSSLENIGRFKDNYNQYMILKQNKKFLENLKITNIF